MTPAAPSVEVFAAVAISASVSKAVLVAALADDPAAAALELAAALGLPGDVEGKLSERDESEAGSDLDGVVEERVLPPAVTPAGGLPVRIDSSRAESLARSWLMGSSRRISINFTRPTSNW